MRTLRLECQLFDEEVDLLVHFETMQIVGVTLQSH